MAYPTDIPTLTQSQAVTAIAEAEAGVLQCMQEFACVTFTIVQPTDTDEIPVVKDKVDIARSLLCTMAAKENSVGKVLDGLANKIWADKGLVPGSNGDDDPCSC